MVAVLPVLFIIIINPVITCMQDIYNYIRDTNHVSMVHIVEAVLYLQFVLHVMLFRPWNIYYYYYYYYFLLDAEKVISPPTEVIHQSTREDTENINDN